ncbi:hypothetical protein BaRGS_00034475 [Batillaria attramentaria]|uniref:Uncharacterized protein n=1 Tax=Batillaria attramentaria TaxID=370345 RepID=A0ABD0JHB0_9CAEN
MSLNHEHPPNVKQAILIRPANPLMPNASDKSRLLSCAGRSKPGPPNRHARMRRLPSGQVLPARCCVWWRTERQGSNDMHETPCQTNEMG